MMLCTEPEQDKCVLCGNTDWIVEDTKVCESCHHEAQQCKTPMSWDRLVKAAGVDTSQPDYIREAYRLIGVRRPPGPRLHPSTLCESGKRPYCTCDLCY